MSHKEFYFTSESVSEGHPDKVADRISDAVLDAYLTIDPEARVAVETLVTENLVVLAGEVRAPRHPAVEEIVRQEIRNIGYDDARFHPDTVRIENHLHEQASEIAQGVDENDTHEGEEGAGDQGIMFGYATNETKTLMPAPIYYANKILEECAKRRKAGDQSLRPDAKSQVTLKYVNGRPESVKTVLLSHQHAPETTQDDLLTLLKELCESIFPKGWLTSDTKYLVNPTGSFIEGGPAVDTGLTGRKIIVDTYGGMSRHGGGAFSGKDPTKVDRSAAYAARYLAKNIVAAGFAEDCEIQLCYAIGVAEPLAIYLETFGTIKQGVTEQMLVESIRKSMSLTPRGIRKHLGLNKPMYIHTTSYGHFGREPLPNGCFSWEKTDLVDQLKANLPT